MPAGRSWWPRWFWQVRSRSSAWPIPGNGNKLAHPDEHNLRRRLRKQGMSTLLEDDLAKVAEGITTLAEMQAVGGLSFYTPVGGCG